MTRILLIGAVAALALGTPSIVAADEISELKEQLAVLQKRIEELESKQKQMQQEQQEQIQAKVTEAVAEKEVEALPDNLKWLEKIKISGDLRLRHEHIDSEEVKDDGSIGWKNGRDRQRYRARLRVDAQVNDEWDLGFRFASGETDFSEDEFLADPVSTNQTLTNFSSHKDFWVDWAYADYHPEAMEGLNVIGGKMPNPFFTVGKNQLVYDSDLSPEGIATRYATALSDTDTLYLNGGALWVDESSSDVDTFLWGIQSYLKHDLSDQDHVLAGVSYWDYTNIQGKTTDFEILYGNTQDPAETEPTWLSDYDILELFGEYGTRVCDLPAAVFGSYVYNTSCATSYDTGWLIGGKLGAAKEVGSWEFVYDYRDLDRDAVLAVWTDSDSFGGGTGARGHRFTFTYQLAKNIQTDLTYFHDDVHRTGEPLAFRRLMADLVLKF